MSHFQSILAPIHLLTRRGSLQFNKKSLRYSRQHEIEASGIEPEDTCTSTSKVTESSGYLRILGVA